MSARTIRGALALLVVLAAAPAHAAHAASWSAPRALDAPSERCRAEGLSSCVVEPAPRVAVTATGAAAAAWVDPRGRVRAAVATTPGQFGDPRTVAARGLRPSAAVAPDGTATVVWAGRGGVLRFARRPPRARAFAPARPLAPRGSRRGDDFPNAAGQPDGSTVVVYESGDAVRSVTISPTGAPAAPVTLGRGGFGRDSVRVAADGTLALCCLHPTVTDPNVPPDTAARVAVHRPAAGWTLLPLRALDEQDAVETVFATATDVALGTIRVSQGGDAGLLGVPGLARAGAGASLGAPLLAPVLSAGRGLAPDVALDGSGRSVLVFQEKSRPRAFSRSAPVYASVAPAGATSLPRRQRLTSTQAYEPAVRPLGPGAVAVWQAPRHRWGVAIERGGTFRPVGAPAGPGPSTLGEDFSYAYDLESAGPFAVLAWVARDGAIRVSELDARR